MAVIFDDDVRILLLNHLSQFTEERRLTDTCHILETDFFCTSFYFLVGNLFMTLFRARAGFLTASVFSGWLSGLAGVAIGTYIGAKVFRRIPLPFLRRVIYLYMALSGMVLLLS